MNTQTEEAAEKFLTSNFKIEAITEHIFWILQSFKAGALWQQSQLLEKEQTQEEEQDYLEEGRKFRAILKEIQTQEQEVKAVGEQYMDGLTRKYGTGSPNKYQYTGKKCVAGCKNFTAYETKHHPDCPFYPNSLSEKYDKIEQELTVANEKYGKVGKAVGDSEIEIGTMWCEVVFAVLQADKAGKEVGEFIPTELESKFTIKRK